jgi:hypothetical protein
VSDAVRVPSPIIALLTDFGDRDEYVGVMKGVILSRAPGACIVDLCHHIVPHDIRQAAAMIDASFGYFPDHALFVMVVDPGVGGERSIVLATAGARSFVCPDNGLLTGLIRRGILDTARRITNQALFGDAVSPTFHGRSPRWCVQRTPRRGAKRTAASSDGWSAWIVSAM